MKTKTPKKRLTGKAVDREIDEERARLRKYLGKLTLEKPRGDDSGYEYRLPLTFRMFTIVYQIDKAMVGTPDYMGIAGWWSYEYKFDLREATNKERKKAHDAILAAGLPLEGESKEHAQIVAWATNNGRLASKAMGSKWSPYRGPRPAKRKAAT